MFVHIQIIVSVKECKHHMFVMRLVLNMYIQNKIILILQNNFILMKVEWNDYPTQEPAEGLGEIRQTRFLNLSPSEESTLSTFFSKVMRPKITSKYQDDDGKQVFVAQYLPAEYNLYTTPYLKVYEPFNTTIPKGIAKRLATLFENANV